MTETDLGKRTKAKTSDNDDLTSCVVQRFQWKQNKKTETWLWSGGVVNFTMEMLFPRIYCNFTV